MQGRDASLGKRAIAMLAGLSSVNRHIHMEILESKPGSFVFEARVALSAETCEQLIERFEAATDEQYPGRVGQMASPDRSIKQSTDLVVSGTAHWADLDRALFDSLGVAMGEFKQLFPFFAGSFRDMGYAVQRTLPGEFYHWHIDSGSHAFSTRQLVAIWYLNDVPGPGGATEFQHQQVAIRPEQGKLLLFPPFWTHEHRGAELKTGTKYIATTWVLFG